jgi:nucleotide-binding universal stress UspA family protein
MKPLTSILAATDLSAPARHAVERAFLIAAQTHCELHIVHAMELEMLDSLRELLGANLSQTKALIEADARARLEQLASNPDLQHGIAPHLRVVSGNPLEVVPGEADALDAALVVFGARGESYLRHAMLGSTAARVIRKTRRHSVLVVKQSPHEAYRHVLVAMDFSPASLRAIRAAKRWAPAATLVLLHAFELPYEGLLWRAGVEQQQMALYIKTDLERRRAQLDGLAAEAGLKLGDYIAEIRHGFASQQIIALEQEYDADLIVVGKHGKNFTEELLLGSVTKHVLGESQCDVLVVADSGRAASCAPA